MPSKRIAGKLLVLFLWLIGTGSALVLWRQSGLSLDELPGWLAQHLEQFGTAKAAALFLLMFTLRPLIFFPSSLLTIAAGLLFGPLVGSAVAVVGENLGSNLAFTLTRRLGRDWVSRHETAKLRRWDDRLQANGVVTVLVMRLAMLPFDSVSYASGLTSMRHHHFAIGTLLGAFPAILSLSLFGGAGAAADLPPLILFGTELSMRLALVILAALIAVTGLAVAIWLRAASALRSDDKGGVSRQPGTEVPG